jgi:tetratricopeptide (TPR) repeat protein
MVLEAGCSGGRSGREALQQANALIAASKDAAAVPLLEQVIAGQPKGGQLAAEAYALLGDIAARQGKSGDAVRLLSQAVALDPGNRATRIALARNCLAAKQFSQARTVIDGLLKESPQQQEVLLLSASLHLALQEDRAAQNILEEMLARGAHPPEAYMLLSTVKSRQKDAAGAMEVLKAGIEKNPKSVALLALAARLYGQSGKIEAAAEALKKIIELEPDHISHPLALAALYWDNGKKETAGPLLTAYLEAKDQSSQRRLSLAEFYLQRRQNAAAERVLQEGIAGDPQSFALHQGLSQYYLKTGDARRAVDLLDGYLKKTQGKAPSDLRDGRLALAAALLGQHRVTEAAQRIQEVLTAEPDDLQANFLMGRVHLSQGKGNQALSAFQNVIARRPEALEAYLYLAETHVLMGDLPQAVAMLQQGLQIAPASKALYVALARAQISRKDYKAAEAAYAQAMRIDPGDFKVQAELGDFYLSIKELDRAEREYAEIVSKYPAEATGCLKLARLYFQRQDPTAALNELHQGYVRNPGSAVLLQELVLNLTAAKQGEAALEICRRRLAQNEQEAFTHNLLGRVLAHQGNVKEAEAAFLKASELAPQWQEAANNLAALYLHQNRTDEAVQKLEQALRQNPVNQAAYSTLGAIYEQSAQYPKAIDIYEQALAKLPDASKSAQRLAFLLCEFNKGAQDLERAQLLATQVYQTNPGQIDLLDTLAWVYFHKGEYARALSILQSISQQMPEEALLNYHLGMALLKSGKEQEAREKLEAAVKSKSAFIGRASAEQALASIKNAG